MCSVSAVSQYYQDTYPNRINPYQQLQQPHPGLGGFVNPVQQIVHTFDPETKEMLRQALKLLDKIDKRLGDVECMDDTKAAFLATLGLTPDDISA